MKPDGVFLSNGPGDPEPVTYAQDNILVHDGQSGDLRNPAWAIS